MPLFNWIPKKNSWFWVRVDLGSNIRHRAFIADFLCASLVVNSQCAIFLLMVLPRTHSFSIIAATITLRVIRGILIAKLFCSKVISTLKQFPIFERYVWKKIALHQKGVFHYWFIYEVDGIWLIEVMIIRYDSTLKIENFFDFYKCGKLWFISIKTNNKEIQV